MKKLLILLLLLTGVTQPLRADDGPLTSPRVTQAIGTALVAQAQIGTSALQSGTASGVMATDGSASAPSIAFASGTNTGMIRNPTAAGPVLVANGQPFLGSDPTLGSRAIVASLGWTASSNLANVGSTAADIMLERDAANTLAQRNGTNAQAFRIYNTYTDASNYERGVVQWNTNVYEIGAEAAGTGTNRSVRVKANGAAAVAFNTNSSDRWQVSSSGHFLASTDNTYDIGASGATRPRNVYIAGTLAVGGTSSMGNVYVGSGNALGVGSRLNIQSSADGVMTVSNAANTDFGRLTFGGTTSSFPALKRSSTVIDVRLADDSAYSSMRAKLFSVKDATGGYYLGSGSDVLMVSATAPTISSGFGTSPSIVASNGTAAFTINVGTGGVATSGVIGLPAATTGWAVSCANTSTNTATVFITKQTAFTTTSATIGNYDAAGAAAAWVASNVLVCHAHAF